MPGFIYARTLNGAYASFEEEIKGSLEPGKLADLVILSQDITSIPKERLNEVQVDLTIMDGAIEYEKITCAAGNPG